MGGSHLKNDFLSKKILIDHNTNNSYSNIHRRIPQQKSLTSIGLNISGVFYNILFYYILHSLERFELY